MADIGFLRKRITELLAQYRALPGGRDYHNGYWLAYRLIASSTNYRTFISAVIPPGYVCGNSLAIVRLRSLKQLCFLCGVMNSFVVDYFIRQKVSA
ncbi:MAG: hypothetical protein AABW54_00380, partial [Candidatus Micrarchaeota archaeon]